MKSLILASLLAASSAIAFAGTPNAQTWEPAAAPTGSSLTRAHVVADLHHAQANNQLAFGERVPHVATPSASALTRAQVRGELNTYLHVGHQPLHGDIGYSQL